MDYGLNAEASALKTLVVIAANELIESYQKVHSGPMPKNQRKLAQAVYALSRFGARRCDHEIDVSQGQYME